MKSSKVFWRLTKTYLEACGGNFNLGTRVLDVGVGWGRNYRWILRDLPASNIVGIDVDPKAIQTCRGAMPYGNFRLVAPTDDYPIDGGKYDIVIAYSVFSHLSERAATSVLNAIHRVLKQNAIVALTTFRCAHIDVWSQQTEVAVYGELLASADFNRIEWWERATEGQHLYLQTGGGDPSRPAESYGEAVVPKGWFERQSGFRLVSFERRKDLPQSYVVLQRL